MSVLLFSFICIISLYVLGIIILMYGWKKTDDFSLYRIRDKKIEKKISIIIPVRNEQRNIANLLNDLSKQTYSCFEIIVIDDNSTDNTWEIIEYFAIDKSFISIRYNRLNRYYSRLYTPKKAAICQGISEAEGEIIITTDGDCRVGDKWLENIHYLF